ncbi:hypothetical protein O2N63_16210 [Aliiroseovarius sp. KMU-50]|uniref:Sulfotransferase family protein n=1 Tax=Aliiroseovarius salicola TaxID=3009082 RepID=A0ABT4W6C3_9RHOB|nr:hypothetical protein [Aliiroseovarius sp. KMU-50]MDA5095635.1 hypothetical protein [Aliiroseovarius sp. KMU-50]
MQSINEEKRGVYLHLGAHRTGTGSFQEFLSMNAGRLEDHGVNLAVSNRDGQLRSGLKLRLPGKRHFRKNDLDEHRVWLDEQIDKTGLNRKRLTLVSEENFPGTINTLMSPEIYPIADKRLQFFASKMQKPIRKALFVVRSYDSFFESIFRKRVEFRAIDPFDHYRDDMMTMKRGWVDVIQDIRDATKVDQVHVLRFEDRHGYLRLLRTLLPGLPQDGWLEPDGHRNVSATNAACRAIQKAFHNGEKLSKQQIEDIKLQYAADKGGEAVADFSSLDRTELQDRYAEDLQTIRNLPYVTFS